MKTKKLLFSVLVFITIGNAYAQTAVETSIGYTFYDLQTNNTIGNRLINNPDGTISAVWTFGPTNTASEGYPDRGTGYNYFNGTSWLPSPTSRIETGEGNNRTGFPAIGVTSTGQEVVIANGIQIAGNNLGIISSMRPAKGIGAWFTSDTILGKQPADSINGWPKMAIGGADGKTIHAIWRGGLVDDTILGQVAPILYSRSTDNGVTWQLQQIITPIDSSYYLGFSSDEYSIDANGSNVAVVAGDLGEDVVLARSFDNGDTWTQEVVYQFPIPFFNSNNYTTDTIFPYTGPADTLWTGTGDPTVVIDNTGLAHVFFSMFRMIKTNVAPDSSFTFPNSSLLFYWNENMSAPVSIAGVPNLGDSLPASDPSDCSADPFPYGSYGTYTRILEEPSAGVDANNNLYVCYQTVDELSNPIYVSINYNKFFKHPYIIKSTDGGNTWTNYDSAYDVLRATQQVNGDADDLEGVYACMAKRVDSQIHIIYQRDPYPGTSLAFVGSCEYALNANDTSSIIYVAIDTSLQSGYAPVANFATVNDILCQGSCISFNDSSMNNPTSWNWSFPEGVPSFSSLQNPTNICYNTSGMYDVSLTVTNIYGSDSKTVLITVNPTPVANFSISADTSPHHYIVINNASGTPPLSYVWSWGDGTYDSIPYPTHTYEDSGFYTLCLTVTDSNGCVSTFCDSSFHAMRTTNTMVFITVVPPLVTGIAVINSQTQQVTIYPNPATNQLTIHTSSTTNWQVVTVSIMNVLGQVALSPKDLTPALSPAISGTGTREGVVSIDVSKLPAGMYFLQLKWESGIVVKRFVKE